MTDAEVAALAAIRAVYEEPIAYLGAGLVDAPISAIPTTAELPGQLSVTKRMFAIAQAALSERPSKGNQITHAGIEYHVIQTDFAAETAEWHLYVERA